VPALASQGTTTAGDDEAQLWMVSVARFSPEAISQAAQTPSRTIRGFVASVCSIHGTRKAQSSDFTARPSSTRSWSTMF